VLFVVVAVYLLAQHRSLCVKDFIAYIYQSNVHDQVLLARMFHRGLIYKWNVSIKSLAAK